MVLILIIINCLTSGRYTYYLCFWFGMIIYTEGIYSKVKERIFQLPANNVGQLYKKHKTLQRKESIYKWKKKIL